jgi:two-component system, cell cycle response regulator DivK
VDFHAGAREEVAYAAPDKWLNLFGRNTQREYRLPTGILRVTRQGGRLNDRSGEPKCRTRSSSSLELEVKPNSGLRLRESDEGLLGEASANETLLGEASIIALSAHALAGEREKAIAMGCEEFDTKPIEFDRLVATVRRVLDGRK